MNPKVVFDTNVLVSAIIFGGNPRACLDLARDRKVDMFTSKTLLLELTQKLNKKFQLREDKIENIIKGISFFTTIIAPQINITLIKQDPSDNAVLEAAIQANADYIISGDKKHLLPLKKFKGISIIAAANFLKSCKNEILIQ
jgi:uncharacterized protein